MGDRYVAHVKYAVNIPPFTDVATVVSIAVDAERAGWDGVFLWDHVQWSPDRPDVHDPWVLLGAIAQATERVRLGTLVTPLSRRRPTMVAKQITTLDHLSRGRATLGVGLGAPDDLDFGDLGDESDRRTRAAILDESLELLDGLLGGPVTHRRALLGDGRPAASAPSAATAADLGSGGGAEPATARASPPLGRCRPDRRG